MMKKIIPEGFEQSFLSFQENERKDFTYFAVEQIRKYVSPLLLHELKATRKFIYLMGNGFYSVPEALREKSFSWQNYFFGFSQKDNYTIINKTKIGHLLTKVKTFPSYSTSKSLTEESIFAFPIFNLRFFWSPLVTNLNLFLKNIVLLNSPEKENWNFPTRKEGKELRIILKRNKDIIKNIQDGKYEDIFPLLDQLAFRSDDLKSALLSGNEIIFYTPDFYYFHTSEISEDIFKTSLWKEYFRT